MNRLDAIIVYTSTALTTATGLAYAVLRYAVPPPDEFSLMHPATPVAQHLHVLSAPLLVFALGAIWHVHAWRHWRHRAGHGRHSGMIQVFAAAPMVMSGYLLQISTEPFWRDLWMWMHIVASIVWMLAFACHVVRRLTRRRREAKTIPLNV